MIPGFCMWSKVILMLTHGLINCIILFSKEAFSKKAIMHAVY
jgi:hypothetical protein